MCHLLEQLNLTLGLWSRALTDPGHFLWIWISLEHKYSGAGLLLAQIMPLLDRAGLCGLLDYGVHWFRTFTGGISSRDFFSVFFFPLTSGVCLFASLSTLRSKRESEGNRWTGSQTHRIGPKKFYKSFARRRRGKRRRRTSEFLSLSAINIFAKYCQMNLSSV